MNIHSLQLKAGRNAALLAIAAGLAFAAAAQPAGNPKGSAPPPTSDAQKPPASRAPTAGFGDSGKIVTDRETVKSRSQTTNSSGNAGQTGPAPGKTPNRSNSGAGATAKPPPQ